MDTACQSVHSDATAICKRYNTLLKLYEEEFVVGLGKEYSDNLFISKELLHCAVNAYFDDICKYKLYAGSEFADRHKQGAFTMIWLSRFKPIQIKEGIAPAGVYLTINESFAIYAGLMFLNPAVADRMTDQFFNHLIYTLTYRQIGGRPLATILYLMETAAINGVKF